MARAGVAGRGGNIRVRSGRSGAQRRAGGGVARSAGGQGAADEARGGGVLRRRAGELDVAQRVPGAERAEADLAARLAADGLDDLAAVAEDAPDELREVGREGGESRERA